MNHPANKLCPLCSSMDTVRLTTSDQWKYRCTNCNTIFGDEKLVRPGDEENVPKFFWFAATMRGNKELLIVYFGPSARGSIEVENKEEKEAWLKILEELNSTYKKYSSE